MYQPGTLEPESSVLVVGDLHANTGAAFGVIDHAAAHGARVILQGGDFGWWPREEHGRAYLRKVESRLALWGLELWWIDGNHEDFHTLARLPIGPDGRRQVDEHLWHLPRGFRWRWNRSTWVAVGGAVSMDKASRIEGKDWFADEELTLGEAEQIVDDGPADIVLSHDAPLGVPYLRQELRQDLPAWRRDTPWPTGRVMHADEHQRLVRAVVDGTHATKVFHGHHHARYSDTLATPHGPVAVMGLGMDQDPLVSRCILTTPDGDPVG
jgi:hypothetical protein